MTSVMNLKERNQGLTKKKRLLADAERRIAEFDNIFKRLLESTSATAS